MNCSEQNTASRMLAEALDARLKAAELYVRFVEFAVPLVEGDGDIIKDARRAQGEVEHFCNTTKANLNTARPESWRETLRELRG